MQWDATPHAGFSTAEPWLPVADGFDHDNVQRERTDPASIYHLYRRLIALRRRSPSLQIGDYVPIVASGDLLVYVRRHASERTLVALNLGRGDAVVTFPGLRGDIVLTSAADRDRAAAGRDITLRGDEGVVLTLAADVVVPRFLV
jgi:alpha-glucosidase